MTRKPPSSPRPELASWPADVSAKGRAVVTARFITIRDIAEELATGSSTIRDAINRGDLQAFRDGRLWRVERLEADRWIASKMTRRRLD